MIYLGDNWPAEYRNNAFMLNIHGHRLNRDMLERHGSGYVAHHAPDFASRNDPWFRGLDCQVRPRRRRLRHRLVRHRRMPRRAKKRSATRPGGRIFKIVYDRN